MKTPTLAALLSALLFAACGTGPEGAGPSSDDDSGSRDDSGRDAGVVDPERDGGLPPDAGDPDPHPEPEPEPDAGVRVWIRDWVVSPSGADTGAGTEGAPLRTIVKALSLASPGERILVKPGTYAERVYISGTGVRAGTAALPIRLQGEGNPKLIPQASSGWTMVQVDRSYWEIDGFEIDAQGQAKVAVGFGNASVGGSVTNCNIHGGSHNSGVSIFGGASGVLVANNEIHHFQKVNDDSHGVHVQFTTRNVTIRRNTIHDNSGDSVQCEGPEPYDATLAPAQGVIIEDNVMYADREQAVDIKTCHDVRIARNVMRNYAQLGGAALVVHYSASNVTVEDNQIHDVGKGMSIGGNVQGGPVLSNIILRKNRIWNVTHSAALGFEGVGIRLENVDKVQVLHNTIWKTGFAAIRAGGGSNYGVPTSNATIQNNILAPEGGHAYYLGSALTNFKGQYNLVAPAATISAVNSSGGREALSFTAWQASGQESGSRQADPALNTTTLAPGANAVDWALRIDGISYCGAGPDVGAVETGCR